MASAFSLALYPWVYVSKFTTSNNWHGAYREQPHLSAAAEAALGAEERADLLAKRNHLADLPLVNYTTQYGLGCFEGLKALPHPDGTLHLFRPDQNAIRMRNSMVGLGMPACDQKEFVDACLGIVARNAAIGFAPSYDATWERDHFVSANSVYIRPFTYAEPGIGVNLSRYPWLVIISTPVGSYFDPAAPSKAITTDRVRATRGGTGWIKCDANYVLPALVKNEIQGQGFMEVIFLDSQEHRYVEEGSSSNIFFLMKDGTLVTPSLDDTILPGITRASILQLARDRGVTCQERRIAIDEVMSDAAEAFVTGTAAGISFLESVTHQGREVVFRQRRMGDLTRELLHELKGIQYGAVADRHNWLTAVPRL